MILEEIKNRFLEELGKYATFYMVAGNGSSESPMWLQFVDIRGGYLKFQNSQKSGIVLRIPVSEDVKEYVLLHPQETYDYFKYLKYVYLKENCPTIYEEIQGTQKMNIETFLINNH